MIYKQKDGISIQMLGQDVMLYDAASDKVHMLNETGAIIWELLDGTNTVQRIEDTLRQKFKDIPPERISQDTREILEKLEREGLITQ